MRKGGRRVQLQLSEEERRQAALAAASLDDEYEEESVFIPHSAATAATATRPLSTATPNTLPIDRVFPSIPAASAVTPAPSAPSGLATLLNYSSDDEDDTGAANVPATLAAVSTTVAPASSSAPSSSDAPLPPGWSACVDEASGDTYWWNERTYETTWDRPAGQKQDEKQADTSVPPGLNIKAPLVAASAASTAAASSASPVAASPAVAAISSAGTSTSINASAGESTAPPAGVDVSDAESDDDASSAADETALPLPPGWQEVADPDGGGGCYYWCESTNETTWDRPIPTADELAAATDRAIENARFRELREQAQDDIREAKAKEDADTAAAAAAGTPPAAKSTQSMLISALLAGLQARMKPHLARPVHPLLASSVQDSLSPLLRFHAGLEMRLHDWSAASAAEQSVLTPVWMRALQRATLAVDDVIAEEAQWRSDKEKAFRIQQQEQYQQYQQTVYGGHMPAMTQPAMHMGMHALRAAAPSAARPTPQIVISAPAAVKPAPPPPAVSGFVHPSRVAVVSAIAAPPPPVASPAAAAAAAAAAKRKRTRPAATGDVSDAPKRKKGEVDPSKLGRMSALVAQWKTVAAKEEQAAQRRSERERAAESEARWRDQHNSNLIPIGDWRHKINTRAQEGTQ